ncbi:MAG: rRNA pseudouridine synthase [Fimbriimonadaceae bacterium]|nr:rRNA pseudouridine synthase [Fimbriimonadaceae bacterium]
MPDAGEMRLHRYLAHAGVASRRKAEEVILEGRVTVNGSLVTELGVKVGPDDIVEVDGEAVRPARHVYLLLNKPAGYVTTLDDPHSRRTVMDLVPDVGAPVKPVGRLDMDTEGLLVLTNDGDLAARLSHARYGVEKEYLATVQGQPDDRDLERLRKGVFLEGKKTSPAVVELVSPMNQAGTSLVSLVIHEGRKRQVRMMLAAVGCPVVRLVRVRIAHLVQKGMKPGECRTLHMKDVQRLRALVGLER